MQNGRLLSTALSRKNSCDLNIFEHGHIIDFKNYEAFPEYKGVLADKTKEIMTEQQKEKQKALNESMNFRNSKVDKIFWSEIITVKFESKVPEKMLFKYSYKEDFQSANFSLPKRDMHVKQKQE